MIDIITKDEFGTSALLAQNRLLGAGMGGLTVLSLFDGMSCGQLALQRAGIKVKQYYAAEIDKYAIQVTQANFPDTIQLGDVTKVFAKDLPKIDLIIGGSPCQGFSFAGKQLNFKDERSVLFFEYVRLLNECKPAYFFLENVRMKREYEIVISKYLGVEPILINSALMSAQNRERLYWTNINAKPYNLFGDMMPDIPQPKDKGIVLKDILENAILNNRGIKKGIGVKSINPVTEEGKQTQQQDRVYDIDYKMTSLCSSHSGRHKILVENPGESQGNRIYNEDGLCPTLSGNAIRDLKVMVKANTLTPDAYLAHGERNRDENGRAVLTSMNQRRIRKLTPVECERLQTVPDNYTNHVSSMQRYKMLGNGWTVDVIAYIFGFMKSELAKSVEW